MALRIRPHTGKIDKHHKEYFFLTTVVPNTAVVEPESFFGVPSINPLETLSFLVKIRLSAFGWIGCTRPEAATSQLMCGTQLQSSLS